MDNKPVSKRISSQGTTTPLTPAQVAALYNFPSNSAKGQTIGVLEFAGGYFLSPEVKNAAKRKEIADRVRNRKAYRNIRMPNGDSK